ncbi:MAG: NAD(P)/FAD-dependent oxidoreductase [Bdellovibrionales bacterium]|nr:NAD(P)/FAD-dependent oxidoreductase [Bdellovibrionales bacterium]
MRVLIIGGGFAGLNAAKTLGHKKDVEVTLVDKRNHHLFQPLLYQVATAGLSPAEIAVPIRNILSDYSNISVVLDGIERLDLESKKAYSKLGVYEFDFLIMACGSSHSYFGNDSWENFAPGLKSLEQATEIRRRILLSFERAENSKDIEEQKAYLTFVIVGGGPTGVELAGSIAELSRVTLSKDFRNIDPSKARVILIEAGPRVLAGFQKSLSDKAQRSLEDSGVQVWTNSMVTNIDKEGVQVGKDFVHTKCALWAAGVATSPLTKDVNSNKDKAGRLVVNKDLSLEMYPEVFVTGDMAAFKNNGDYLPGLAPVAIQQGQHAAHNILNKVKGQPTEDFKYFDKGMMATIGRNKAVLQTDHIKMNGFFAWMAWLIVHIYFLIGFKNRILVLFQWAWAYFTYKRGARLIVSKKWKE